jgi:hypothetical protein
MHKTSQKQHTKQHKDNTQNNTKTIHKTTQKQYTKQHKQYTKQQKQYTKRHKNNTQNNIKTIHKTTHKQYTKQNKNNTQNNTKTIHKTTQKQYTKQHTKNTQNNTKILKECGPCPVLASYTLAFALQLSKKHGKTSILTLLRRAKGNLEASNGNGLAFGVRGCKLETCLATCLIREPQIHSAVLRVGSEFTENMREKIFGAGQRLETLQTPVSHYRLRVISWNTSNYMFRLTYKGVIFRQ